MLLPGLKRTVSGLEKLFAYSLPTPDGFTYPLTPFLSTTCSPDFKDNSPETSTPWLENGKALSTIGYTKDVSRLNSTLLVKCLDG